MKKIEFVGIEVPENKNLVRTDMESGVLFTFEEKEKELFFYGRDLCYGFDHSVSTTLDTFDDSEIEYIDFNDWNNTEVDGRGLLEGEEEPKVETLSVPIGTRFKYMDDYETTYIISGINKENGMVDIRWEPISSDDEKINAFHPIKVVNTYFKTGTWFIIGEDNVKKEPIHPDIVIGTNFKIKGSETIYQINNVNNENVEICITLSSNGKTFFMNRKVKDVNENFKTGKWVKVVDELEQSEINTEVLCIPIKTHFKDIFGGDTIYTIINVNKKNNLEIIWRPISNENYNTCISARSAKEHFKSGRWVVFDENDNKKSEKQSLNVPIGTRFMYQHIHNTLIGEIINTTGEKYIIVDWGDTNTPQYASYSIEEVDIFFTNNIWIKI